MDFLNNDFKYFLFSSVFFTLVLLVNKLAFESLEGWKIVSAWIAGFVFGGIIYFQRIKKRKK